MFARHAIAALLTCFAWTWSPALAQVVENDGIYPPATVLRAGQFFWYPVLQPVRDRGGVSVVISLPQQMAYVYRDEQLIAVSTVSTGKKGKETPVGSFQILQKKVFHRSNLYSNAPMPHMQRLTWDGIALHAGVLPGYPASHGCIRFPKTFARDLYAITEMGGEVVVTDAAVEDSSAHSFGVPPPMLIAVVENLGGDAFDVVTMRDKRPAR